MTRIQSSCLCHGGTSSPSCNGPPAEMPTLNHCPPEIHGIDHDTVLKCVQVLPVPFVVARSIIVRHHYRHSLPGGTDLAFGVFLDGKLRGALTLGAGPANAHCLVDGASPADCLTLTRLWLSDELPPNSESRAIGIVLRSLRRHTDLKFLVSYADPSHGHLGVIYQATNWVYTGLSQPMPLYDLGDGVARHSRSLAHAYGTHSVRYLAGRDIPMKLVPQAAKHRYVQFLDRAWRSRLRVPPLPYPKQEVADERD